MSRFTEKQLLLFTIAGSALLALGFAFLVYLDLNAIYAAEITDENPEAAEITDPEEWGELRKIYELEREMEAAQAEADKIPERERDVIVYREIVDRDSAILPNQQFVNELVNTIGEHERVSGVVITQVSDLDLSGDKKGKSAIATLPVKLRLSGSFDQVLKFVNLFENLDRMVNTRGFNITAGRGKDADFDGTPVHDVTLDLETYVYTATAGLSKPVNIVSYEKRKQDPVIQKLIRQQKPAYVEKYQLKPRVNRRDPLNDPRIAASGGPDGGMTDGATEERQREILDKLKFEITLLRDNIALEQQFLREKKYLQYSELKAHNDEKIAQLAPEITAAVSIITIPYLAEELQAEVVTPFEEMKSGRKIDAQPVLISKSEASQYHQKMLDRGNAGDHAAVLDVWTRFEDRMKGHEVAEDAAPLVAEMKELAKDAQVMSNFSRLGIKVSGLILRDTGSRVIINGSVYEVGDYIDENHKCRLDGISEELLIFFFEGTRIEFRLED